MIARLRHGGIQVSLFIDPDLVQVEASRQAGADAVEINTGVYAAAVPGERARPLARVIETARAAAARHLEVLAGHGLSLRERRAHRRDPGDRRAQHRPQHHRPRCLGRDGARRAGDAGAPAMRRVAGRAGVLPAVLLLVGAMGLRVGAQSTVPVSLHTSDGMRLAGTLYQPSHRPAPAVILLHMQTRSSADWRRLAERLAEAGIAALAIDFRGHGASGSVVLAPDGTGGDLNRNLLDVQAARSLLTEWQGPGAGRIGIAGASIGANLAALHAAADPTIRSLALLSAGLDYRGLRIEAAMRKYGERPAFIVASLEDPYATRSARQLTTFGNGIRELRLLSEAGHGTVMLSRQPDLVDLLVDWFQRTLL